MDDRTFGAQVVEIPDEIRLRMRGDLDARADDTLQDAYREVAAPGSRAASRSTSRTWATSTAPGSPSSCASSPTPGATAAASVRSA